MISSARTVCTSSPSRSSNTGLARRFATQAGFFGAPPIEPTARYTPSCSTRMSGALRICPDFAPMVYKITTGSPSSVVPSTPPLDS
ncbi:Uncharacterised protein [Mycobacteroides abscessus subsp. abscessus]|nr:Uncharacterised protein [Mycobacteroides abscessus subsp. abscessus]